MLKGNNPTFHFFPKIAPLSKLVKYEAPIKTKHKAIS